MTMFRDLKEILSVYSKFKRELFERTRSESYAQAYEHTKILNLVTSENRNWFEEYVKGWLKRERIIEKLECFFASIHVEVHQYDNLHNGNYIIEYNIYQYTWIKSNRSGAATLYVNDDNLKMVISRGTLSSLDLEVIQNDLIKTFVDFIYNFFRVTREDLVDSFEPATKKEKEYFLKHIRHFNPNTLYGVPRWIGVVKRLYK